MTTGPSVIGRYQIRSRLGEGGMGVVYLAHDPAMDCDVAIKLLRDSFADEGVRKRFAREAQMARRVGIHPNVVTIFDIGEHDGRPFIAMEYLSGETLELIIRRQALPPMLRRLHMIEDVCTGLTHAHKAGLVHRDIKPANVMVSEDGTVKILDFGIARPAESDLTAEGIVIGALNYMSPEQITGGALDHRSDVFAVGALFYELLSGRRAFPGTIREGLPYRIIHGAPEPLGKTVAQLDPEIERIVMRALEKDPAKRYQDVATMRQEIARVRRQLGRRRRAAADDIETALVGRPGAAVAAAGTPSGGHAQVETHDRIATRGRWVGVAAGVGVAALVAAGVGAWFSGRFTAVPPTVAPPRPAPASVSAPAPEAASASSAASTASRAASAPASEPVEVVSQGAKPAAMTSSPAPAAPVRSPETMRLLRSARAEFANGHRGEALDIVEAALGKKNADPEWLTIARSWHQQAAADVANARVEANERQAPAKAQEAYQDAVRAEEHAKQLTQEGKAAAAVRTLWEAEGLFVKAGQQAELASQAAAAASSSKPAVPPPTGASAGATASAPAPFPAGATAKEPTQAPVSQLATGATRQADPIGQPPPRAGQGRGVEGPPAPPEAEVRHALREFELAWDRGDAEGVRRVQPTFAADAAPRFRNFTLRFEQIQISVNGSQAVVRALAHHTPRVTARAGGSARAVPTILRFQHRDDRHWILKGMQAEQ